MSIPTIKVGIALLLSTVAYLGVLVAADEPRSKFISRSELVLIPVLVTDEHGTPVEGLRKEDFSVSEDGRKQLLYSFDPPLSSFSASQPTQLSESKVWVNTEQASPHHLTIIALDPQNTTAGDMRRAVEAVRKFLNRGLTQADPVALVVFEKGHARMVHHFSADSPALLAALNSTPMAPDMLFTPPIDASALPGDDPASRKMKTTLENMQLTAQRQAEDSLSDMTADSMLEIARIFATCAGQKSLIWITDGFKLRPSRPTLAALSSSAAAGAGTQKERWYRTFRALNTSGIAVFPLDAGGVATLDLAGARQLASSDSSEDSTSRKLAKAITESNEERNLILDAYHWLAKETGGRVFTNANDIDRGIGEAYAMSASAYLIAIRPSKRSKGWHRLDVKVNRPGVRVLARLGYDSAMLAEAGEAQNLFQALSSPFAQTGFPLAVSWDGVQGTSQHGSIVGFTVMLPPGAVVTDESGKVSLDISALAFSPDEKRVGSLERKIDLHLDVDRMRKLAGSGLSYGGQMELPAGKCRVHIVVRDILTGRIASVWSEVSVN